MPLPLLDCMEVINISRYTLNEKASVYFKL